MMIKKVLSNVLVLVASLLLAFFGVLNVLFSDSTGPRDAEIAVGYVAILYLVVTTISQIATRQAGWRNWWWFVVPALVLGLGFSASDGGLVSWYPWTIMLVMAGATALGVKIGHLVRPQQSEISTNGS